jgi:DNA-binding transcriptional ArsR family regulator
MEKIQDKVKIMKILCNPKRLAIISLLSDKEEGLFVNQISESLSISQSLTSHLLSYLEASGIVTGVRSGQLVRYKMDNSPFVSIVLQIVILINHPDADRRTVNRGVPGLGERRRSANVPH